MNWQVSTTHGPGSTPSDLFDGGFSWGLVLIGLAALLALTAVCTFGILARVRDRAADRRSLEVLRRSEQPTGPSADRPPKSGDSGPSGDPSTMR
jgi:hypothetical protein